MKFTPINLQTWPRGQMFYYFSKMAPTGYSLTVDLDATHMRSALKKAGLKLFPAYLWLVTQTLNRQVEFRIAELDGQLGYYDTLTPLYAAFHEYDRNFPLMWTGFYDDFSVFYQRYMENREQHGNRHGVLAQPDTPPPANCYTVSCIPWITFSHFAVHSDAGKPYYYPSIESGGFYEKDGRTLMPLSITCHHATTDGYHVSCFLRDLQHAMNGFPA